MSKTGGEPAADGDKKYVVRFHSSLFSGAFRHEQEGDAQPQLRIQEDCIET